MIGCLQCPSLQWVHGRRFFRRDGEKRGIEDSWILIDEVTSPALNLDDPVLDMVSFVTV
jgi:hypothetical protein